jgi:hypothetical protein
MVALEVNPEVALLVAAVGRVIVETAFEAAAE